MNKYRDCVGKPFGRLTVVAYLPKCLATGELARFQCDCACGSSPVVPARNVLRTRGTPTRSCGCLRAELSGNRRRSHGMSRTPEWVTWRNMRSRCEVPGHQAYHNYGGRGIKVCPRWATFENFLADMGPRPTAKHTLERKKNHLGYSPDNCVWATRGEQANNRRSCRMITFAGKTQTLSAWSREKNIKITTLCRRFDLGWSLEKALTTPTRGTQP